MRRRLHIARFVLTQWVQRFSDFGFRILLFAFLSPDKIDPLCVLHCAFPPGWRFRSSPKENFYKKRATFFALARRQPTTTLLQVAPCFPCDPSNGSNPVLVPTHPASGRPGPASFQSALTAPVPFAYLSNRLAGGPDGPPVLGKYYIRIVSLRTPRYNIFSFCFPPLPQRGHMSNEKNNLLLGPYYYYY